MTNSYAHVVKGNQVQNVGMKECPNMVLDETCLNHEDFSLCLLGKVKEFASLINLKVILGKEGYANIELKYMGGFWVMIVFQDDETKKRSHEDDMYGGVSENLKDVECESDRKEIPETNFEEVPDKCIFEGNSVRQNDVHSEDPFGIYEVLNKKRDGKNIDDKHEDSLKYPPGFTPNEEVDVPVEKVDNWLDENRVNDRQEDGVCVGQHVHERVRFPKIVEDGANDCYNCGKSVHYVRDCRLPKRVEENMNLVMEEEEKVDGIVMMAYEEIVEEEALMAYEDDVVIDTQWYLDTAARNHMCGDKGLFLEMKEIVDASVLFGDEAKGYDLLVPSHHLQRSCLTRKGHDGGLVWHAKVEKEVIDDEIGSIMENNTLVLSDLLPGCKPLGYKWIFKRKMKVDGTIDKFKARLPTRFGGVTFNSFIVNAGLVKVPLGGCSFTWCHKSAKKMSKFDRFFISDNLMCSCPSISSTSLDRFLSDHRPIIMREAHYDYGPIPFKFFHYWFELDGFDKLVEQTWLEANANDQNSYSKFMNKLKYLKEKIRIWARLHRESLNSRKSILKAELADLDGVIDKGEGSDADGHRRREVVR
nr:RNA-directed DNA polymerase, eukaryota, reverse transcriptase zinc-binding domain protein [Tanacetum cinerariifolium]